VGRLAELLEESRGHLQPGEEPFSAVAAAWGVYARRTLGTRRVAHGVGVVLATDRRILLYARKHGGYELQSIPYAEVSWLGPAKTVTGATIRFRASGGDVRVRLLEADDLPRLVEAIQPRLAGGA
jgi:hypothetical protein